jgi:hypothetical protein
VVLCTKNPPVVLCTKNPPVVLCTKNPKKIREARLGLFREKYAPEKNTLGFFSGFSRFFWESGP